MKAEHKRTLCASYIGYITQAIVNNLAPLLFVIFQRQYGLTVAQIGFLVTFNFGVQILVDFLAARYAEKIGYKKCIVAAHIFSAAGLLGLGILPELVGNAYLGLMLAIGIYAVGSGLIEVLVSSIVQALPLDAKSAAMSLLHSFYCWGHMLVVLLTTVFFCFFGTENWKWLAALWALIPLGNVFLFAKSPVQVPGGKGKGQPAGKLLRSGFFWLLAVLMICSGASEQAMSQWASYFAEQGLGVSKTAGDLLGPCLFALLMGLSRLVYGIFGERIHLKGFISASGLACVAGYLLAVFAPHPLVNLIGCGVCGMSVGIMWPGVFSLAAGYVPSGGTAMFGLLALAGDLGCSVGPSVVGSVSSGFGGELKAGLLAAIAFPLVLVLGIQLLRRKQ
ncbi:MAG: MFS transporter [Oscillospiraceae bacterium]|nr:MFS transporter [Oscillospiraceae bacterium]